MVFALNETTTAQRQQAEPDSYMTLQIITNHRITVAPTVLLGPFNEIVNLAAGGRIRGKHQADRFGSHFSDCHKN
jgi:hypothetical protein